MSRHLANFRIRWHIPHPQNRFVNRNTICTPLNRSRYFSSSQRLLRAANHYAVLGVSRDASREQIQQAFLKASKKKHPDINKTPNARTEFQAVLEAKEVLSNPSRRGTYDAVWRMENPELIRAEELRKKQEKQLEEERERSERKKEKERLKEKKKQDEERLRERRKLEEQILSERRKLLDRQRDMNRAAAQKKAAEAKIEAEKKAKEGAVRKERVRLFIEMKKLKKEKENERLEEERAEKGDTLTGHAKRSKADRELEERFDKLDEAFKRFQEVLKRSIFPKLAKFSWIPSVLIGIGFMILLNEFAGATYVKEEQVQATWEEENQTSKEGADEAYARLAGGKPRGALWGGGRYKYGASPDADEQENVPGKSEDADDGNLRGKEAA